MRPHPRIRKTVKWGGAVVGVILLSAVVAGRWRWAQVTAPWGWFASVGSGRLTLGRAPAPPAGAGWAWAWGRRSPPGLWWHFGWSAPGPSQWIDIPLWLLLVLACVAGGLAWRADAAAQRLARRTRCPRCRYDRAGLAPTTRCPECGAPPG